MSKEFSLPVSMMLRPILRQYFKQVWVEDNGVRHYTTNLTANRAGPENSPGQSPSILGSSGFVGGTLLSMGGEVSTERWESHTNLMLLVCLPPLETWNSLTSLDTQVRPQLLPKFGQIRCDPQLPPAINAERLYLAVTLNRPLATTE